jgi:hypothetical protein
VALRRSAGGFRGGSSATDAVFPGYRDVTEIGLGSIATVYRAVEVSTGRVVALKLLRVRDISRRAVESFERESRALGTLGAHPNIVTLYRTFLTEDGRPVLVLELCVGAVSERLRDGEVMAASEVVSLGIKIAGALETAHRAGVLHRDVKPQNVLITEFGEPALADFGVAMLQSASETSAGLFDFTTMHAAPELLEGTATSAATDVYGLASSLYQLVAGRSAFRAFEGESPASVILRILRDPVPPLGLGVPLTLAQVLVNAMSKDAARRPQTAAEFGDQLRALERDHGWNQTALLTRDVSTQPRNAPTGPEAEPIVVPPRAAAEPATVPARPEAQTVVEPVVVPVATPTRPAVETVASAEPVCPTPRLTDRSPRTGRVARIEPAPAVDPIPTVAPVFVGTTAIDPMSLRPSLTLRAGLDAVKVDADNITVRNKASRERVPWRYVRSFESYVEGDPSDPDARGYIIVRTVNDAIDLPATRGNVNEIEYAHAILEAYRLRANALRP